MRCVFPFQPYHTQRRLPCLKTVEALNFLKMLNGGQYTKVNCDEGENIIMALAEQGAST
jgi:hypothetical protein